MKHRHKSFEGTVQSGILDAAGQTTDLQARKVLFRQHPEHGAYLEASELNRLVKMGCGDPHCKIPPEEHRRFQFTAKCHPNERKIDACFDSKTGMIEFRCAICDGPVVRVLVANEGEPAV